jgi:hypothetical protein|tara:strand:- start:421 stop:750 length:330 start_codon:yes stop_codon:yes gene_type:complete
MSNAADANARGVGLKACSSSPFNVVIACAQLNAFANARGCVLNINLTHPHNPNKDILANGKGALTVGAQDHPKRGSLIQACIERSYVSRRKAIVGSTDSGINLNDISPA